MKQKPRQQKNVERRSKERIQARSSPRVGGEYTSCSTNVRNDVTGCTYIQVQNPILQRSVAYKSGSKFPLSH